MDPSDRGGCERGKNYPLVVTMGARKLLEGEKVEVRFSDDGLKGSWHQGTISGCEEFKCMVEYDYLFADDGLSKLVESINISLQVNGLTNDSPKKCRCLFRPLPPFQKVNRLEICYAMCVDALVNDAWWEGVVFDNKEGSPERMIFFPDQGDQLLISIDQLRHTFDWNEMSGEWNARSPWIMLKLLDKIDKKEPLPISIREIWYAVSCMDYFRQNIEEWIFGLPAEWCGLVLDAINEGLSVAQGQNAMQIFPVTESIGTPTADTPEIRDMYLTSSEGSNKHQNDAQPPDEAEIQAAAAMQNDRVFNFPESLLENFLEQYNETRKYDYSEKPTRGSIAYSEHSRNEISLEQGHSMLLDFIVEEGNKSLARTPEEKKRKKDLHDAAKRYLLSVGWKYEKPTAGNENYVSPKGQRYYTFISACRASCKDDVCGEVNGGSLTNGNQCRDSVDKAGSQDTEIFDTQHMVKSWNVANIVAEYSPTAIVDFQQFLSREKPWLKGSDKADINSTKIRKHARKHLVALGWKIYHRNDGGERSLKRYQYCSPDGHKFYSLKRVFYYLKKSESFQFADNNHTTNDNLGSEFSGKGILVEALAEDSRSMIIQPENYPSAIQEYVNFMKAKKIMQPKTSSTGLKQIILKAKKHLLYLGWTLFFQNKNGRRELRYRSPSPRKKTFISLLRACNALLSKQENTEGIIAIVDEAAAEASICCGSDERSHGLRTMLCRSGGTNCYTSENNMALKDATEDKDSDMSCEHITPSDDKLVKHVDPSSGQSQMKGRNFTKLYKRNLKHSMISELNLIDTNPIPLCIANNIKNKKRKLGRSDHKCVSSTRKQAKNVFPLSLSQQSPRTILSWLIDNNVLLPRQKVMYIRKEDRHVLREGQITRFGIRCKCCRKVYTLADFEIHAGCNVSLPAASIFLHDGRSLWECQKQLLNNNRAKQCPRRQLRRDRLNYSNDSICSLCQDGGNLILCDSCPSSFHITCIGLEDVPEGDWFCPSCQCCICGCGDFGDESQKTAMCDQCEREFHVGCTSKSASERLRLWPEGYWFCGDSCLKILWHLQGLLGKQNPTSIEGISWTLLRSRGNDDSHITSRESWIERHSKLYIALDVLHECFVPMIEPHTQTDLVEDLVFNTESELRRLNFWGFYTIILENGDELISVATFRVYGEKVAEMPFIGTRVQYRRRGMCRILVDELEKLLYTMGVERLLLPAVPQLLPTWKNSFGFSEMTQSDKLALSSYTFLGFQGTKMCQKLLRSPTAISEKSVGVSNRMRSISYDCSNTKSNCSFTSEMEKLLVNNVPSPSSEACILSSEDARCMNSLADDCHSSPATTSVSSELCIQWSTLPFQSKAVQRS